MILACFPSIPDCFFFDLIVLVLLYVVVLSGEPEQDQGRGLVDRRLVQSPPHPLSNYIAGRPKPALLFWFCSDFRFLDVVSCYLLFFL